MRRVQESTRGGSILASKDLLERLDRADAGELGIDLGENIYVTVAELEGASEKAIRDAGAVAVSRLEPISA